MGFLTKLVEFVAIFWYYLLLWEVYRMKQVRIWLAVLLAVCLCTGCAKNASQPDVTTSLREVVESGVSSTTSAVGTVTTTASAADTTVDTGMISGTDTTGSSATLGTSSTVGKSTGSSKTTVTTVTSATTTKKPTSSTAKPTTITTGGTVSRPSVSGEMRGVWVSYIELAELFQRCTTPAQARKALDDMMAELAGYGLNTVFFHVRANSDAYYDSALFKPAAAVKSLLNAGFDPLEYAVTAAHKNGLQLHAWVNPYRVGLQTAYLVDGIPTLTDGGGRYYYVPTSTAAQTLILNGIRELLNNYDIDGIQYDDYFYPEGLLSAGTVYSYESADYETYKQGGGTLSVADWRRAGVDMLIAGTHTLTAAKGVVFGVSPAANAQNTYDALYADCRKWLSQPGYVDYLCPQIYTGFENSSSAFDKMVNVWRGYTRHSSVELYFGLALYKIGLKSDAYAGAGKTEWIDHSDVMKRSVQYLRDKQVAGLAFYSYSYFDPAAKAGLSATADVSVAQEEIRNLLSIL